MGVGDYIAELLGWGLSDRASLSGNGNGVWERYLQTYVCQSKTSMLCKRYCLAAIKQHDCTERSALMRSPSWIVQRRLGNWYFWIFTAESDANNKLVSWLTFKCGELRGKSKFSSTKNAANNIWRHYQFYCDILTAIPFGVQIKDYGRSTLAEVEMVVKIDIRSGCNDFSSDNNVKFPLALGRYCRNVFNGSTYQLFSLASPLSLGSRKISVTSLKQLKGYLMTNCRFTPIPTLPGRTAYWYS